MQTSIHPTYNSKITVSCNSCGQTFTSGSTLDEIRVEICSNCHPFYTGKAKIVDTENLVKKFSDRQKQVSLDKVKSKKEKTKQRNTKTQEVKAGSALTLKDMLKQMGK